MLKKLVFIFGLVLSTGAMAEDTACNVVAAQKMLFGPAKESFLKSCEIAARASCDPAAKEKNLAGNVKVTFEKKCLHDAMGD